MSTRPLNGEIRTNGVPRWSPADGFETNLLNPLSIARLFVTSAIVGVVFGCGVLLSFRTATPTDESSTSAMSIGVPPPALVPTMLLNPFGV